MCSYRQYGGVILFVCIAVWNIRSSVIFLSVCLSAEQYGRLW